MLLTVPLALTCTRSCGGGCPPAPGRAAVPPAQGWPGPILLLHPPRRPADPWRRTTPGRWAPCSAGGEAARTRPLISHRRHPSTQGREPPFPPSLTSGRVLALTRLPRRLLLRLPPEPARLWQSASKPRMPPTQSPSSTTCGEHAPVPRARKDGAPKPSTQGERGAPRSQAPAAAQSRAFPKSPLTWPQKPAPSPECRKALYAWLARAMTAPTACW